MIRKLTQEEYNNAADLSYRGYMECGDVYKRQAMGQAFFSLSLGMGCLSTYASYFGNRLKLMFL